MNREHYTAKSAARLSLLLLLVCVSLRCDAQKISESGLVKGADEVPPFEADNELKPIEARTMVKVIHDDLEVRVPVFDEKTRITEEKIKFERKKMKELNQFLLKISEKLVRDNMWITSLGLGGLNKIKNFFLQTKNDFLAYSKIDKSDPWADGYAKRVSGMMLEAVDTKVQKKDRLNNTMAHERTASILNALDKLMDVSPKGLYLDWNEMTFNGEPIHRYIAPIFQNLRDNGRGYLVTIFKWVASMVEKYKSERGSKNHQASDSKVDS